MVQHLKHKDKVDFTLTYKGASYSFYIQARVATVSAEVSNADMHMYHATERDALRKAVAAAVKLNTKEWIVLTETEEARTVALSFE